jgi:hypothetical protein
MKKSKKYEPNIAVTGILEWWNNEVMDYLSRHSNIPNLKRYKKEV